MFYKNQDTILLAIPRKHSGPSHIHAIIAFHNTGKTINSIIANGKRFMAYDIVALLKKQNQNNICNNYKAW